MKIQVLEQLVRDTEKQYKHAKLRLSVIKNRLDVSIARYVWNTNFSFSLIEKLIKNEITEEMTQQDIHNLIDEKLKKDSELA